MADQFSNHADSPGEPARAPQVSYSVYLLAPIVQEVVVIALPPRSFPAIPPHLYILTVMILSVGVASLCYVLLEKPAVAFGKKLSAYLDGGARQRSPITEVI